MKKSSFIYTIIICSLYSCSVNSSSNNSTNTTDQKKQFRFECNEHSNKRNEYSLLHDKEFCLKDQFIYVDEFNILHSNINCKLINEKNYLKKHSKDSINWNISNPNKLCKNCLSYKQYIWMSNYWSTPKINLKDYSYSSKMIEFRIPQIYKFNKKASNVNLNFNKLDRSFKNDSTKRIIIFKNEFDTLNYMGIHISEDQNIFSDIFINEVNDVEGENNEKWEQYYEAEHYMEFLNKHYYPLNKPVIFSKKYNNNIFYVGFTLFEFNSKEYYVMKTYSFSFFQSTITIFALYNIADIKQEFYFDQFINSIILGKNGPVTDATL